MAPPTEIQLVVKTQSQVMQFNPLPKPQVPTITMNGTPIPAPKNAPYYPTGYQLVVINAASDYTNPASILSNQYIQLFPQQGTNWWGTTYQYLYANLLAQTLRYGNPNQQLFILASFGLDNNMPPTNDGTLLLYDYGGGPAIQNWLTHCDAGSQSGGANAWVSIPASYILVGFSQQSWGQGTGELYQPNNNPATLTVTLRNPVPPS
jgi:hypothetical protein